MTSISGYSNIPNSFDYGRVNNRTMNQDTNFDGHLSLAMVDSQEPISAQIDKNEDGLADSTELNRAFIEMQKTASHNKYAAFQNNNIETNSNSNLNVFL